MVCAKLRIRFGKHGALRFISHHDLMRCFERMLRRAALPFHSTQGFNPKPRLIFALPLPLGVIGRQEIAELELDAPLGPDEVHERLAQEAPAGLDILEVKAIPSGTTAHVRQACYRLPVPPERQADLPERSAALQASTTCWIERHRPQRRRVDLRPYVLALRVLPGALEMDLRVTPTGTARPDEVAGLLGLDDLLAQGAVFERLRVELTDEPAAGAEAVSGPVSAEELDPSSPGPGAAASPGGDVDPTNSQRKGIA